VDPDGGRKRASGKSPVLLIGSGERKHSFIAAADVAAFAVAALNNATALNRKISLGGPEPLSCVDIISIMEAQLGRSIPVKRLPVGQAFTHLRTSSPDS